MTPSAEPQEARAPMLQPNERPEIYRLLAVFSGIPLGPVAALEAAGMRVPVTDRHDLRDPGLEELSDEHRALLRLLADQGRIRWVKWPQEKKGGRFVPPVEGYVLTGYGETALEVYRNDHGPTFPIRRAVPLGVLARHRLRVRAGLEAPNPDIDPDVPRPPTPQESDQ